MTKYSSLHPTNHQLSRQIIHLPNSSTPQLNPPTSPTGPFPPHPYTPPPPNLQGKLFIFSTPQLPNLITQQHPFYRPKAALSHDERAAFVGSKGRFDKVVKQPLGNGKIVFLKLSDTHFGISTCKRRGEVIVFIIRGNARSAVGRKKRDNAIIVFMRKMEGIFTVEGRKREN